MKWQGWLNLIGLIFGFVGSVILTIDLFISKKQAIGLGVSRLAGETEQENLKLPAVQQLLIQSRDAKIAFGFLAFGFLLQTIGALPL